jgi:hypothetical protein
MATGTRVAGSTLKRRQLRVTARRACGACGARLSAYNPGPNCYAHTVDVPWNGPGLRPR